MGNAKPGNSASPLAPKGQLFVEARALQELALPARVSAYWIGNSAQLRRPPFDKRRVSRQQLRP